MPEYRYRVWKNLWWQIEVECDGVSIMRNAPDECNTACYRDGDKHTREDAERWAKQTINRHKDEIMWSEQRKAAKESAEWVTVNA